MSKKGEKGFKVKYIKEGLLIKLGGFRKNWRQRYFCADLPTHSLYYFKPKQNVQNLKEATGRIELLKSKVEKYDDKKYKKANCFGVYEVTKKRTFIFHAENQQQVNEWIDAIGYIQKEKRNSTVTYSNLTINDFELLKVVGRGNFGKVMQVRKKDTKKIYAMKILKKKQLVVRKEITHTRTERKVLEQINHPFIVSLRYAFQTESKLYMVLDFFQGGELFYHLSKEGAFSIERARFYTAQIALALDCLHQHNIVYRDLKPENILLDVDGNIKLTDFGLSKESVDESGLTHTFCGTAEYLAPEVICGKPYGRTVDWWSLGTLLYEMLSGLPPFYSENRNEMYEMIVGAKLQFKGGFDKDAKDLISGFLNRDPSKRTGKNGFNDIKKHAFFKKIDWEKLEKKKLKPPFKPKVQGDEDTQNVDSEFTNEIPKDTPVSFKSNLNFRDSIIKFPNFTFVPDEDILDDDEEYESTTLV